MKISRFAVIALAMLLVGIGLLFARTAMLSAVSPVVAEDAPTDQVQGNARPAADGLQIENPAPAGVGLPSLPGVGDDTEPAPAATPATGAPRGRLTRQAPFEDVTHYTYRLTVQDAMPLAESLQRIYPHLRLSVIAEQNAVLLTGGTPQMHERMKAFVDYYDQPQEERAKSPPPEFVREFLAGKNADMLARADKAAKFGTPPAILTLQANGTILIQESADALTRQVTMSELAKLVPGYRRMVLRANNSVEHAKVAEVLSLLRQSDHENAEIVLRALEEPKTVVAGSSNVTGSGKSGSSHATYQIVTVFADGTLSWHQNSTDNPLVWVQRERFPVEGLAEVVTKDGHVRLRVADDVPANVVVKVLDVLRERNASITVSHLPSPPQPVDVISAPAVSDSGIVADPLVAQRGAKKKLAPTGTGEQRIPDITGNWTGEGWGRVELRQTEPGVFRGSYSDTYGQKSGSLALRWSAQERRFNGEWTEGNKDRLGELTVRLPDGGSVLLGAFSADAKSKLNPGHPKLADLQWTRVIPGVNDTPPKPYVLPNDVLLPKTQPPANAQPHLRNYPLVGIMPEVGPPPTDAQRRYQAAEEQVRIRAGGGLRMRVPPEGRTPNESQSLKDAVTTAFDARQELLRQELADFRIRLDRLAKTLEARERDKNAIIQHRVDELLNPNLRWDAAGNPPSGTTGAPTATSSTRGTGSSTSVGKPRLPEPAPIVVAPLSNSSLNQPQPPNETAKQALVRAAEARRKLAEYEIEQAEATLKLVEDRYKKGFVPQTDVLRCRLEVERAKANLEIATAELEAAKTGVDIRRTDKPPATVGPAVAARDRPETKIFHLEFAKAENLAKTLQELASDETFAARISTDAATNSLIVLAQPQDIQIIEPIVRLLDKVSVTLTPDALKLPNPNAAPSTNLPQPATTKPGQPTTAKPILPAPPRAEKSVAKIFRLEQVAAADVAKTLQDLADEKSFTAKISAEVGSNSVIVFASPDDMHIIEAIIIRLDKAPESSSPKAAPKPGNDSSPQPATPGSSNTVKPSSTPLSGELKSWQGRWLLVNAEINGQEQKRDEVSTQSITVSGAALKIAVRNSETKGFLLVDGALKLVSPVDGTKAFIFETPSGKITRQEVETVDGVTRAKEISYEVPTPLHGIYEFRDGKLVLCFYDLGSKDGQKYPGKFQTTPDSDLHLYIFDKVAEPDAAAPAEAETPSGPSSFSR